MNLSDLLKKVTVKDAAFTAAIAGLAYHAYLAYHTLKATVHEHSRDSVVLSQTSAEIPFGFNMSDDDDD